MSKKSKILSVFIAILMLVTAVPVSGFAADASSVTVKFLNMNVAGLPDFSFILGTGSKNAAENEIKIGSFLNDCAYDVIAVQEDFTYHNELISSMDTFKYATNHTGTIPGGDGLNVFTRNIKIYDEYREKWNKVSGGIAEGDPLTPKGILYTVLELENGITVDFYDIHADAFDGGENALSRADEYQQLMDLVEKNSADRPVIITGDFNTSLHIETKGDNGADERAMRSLFFEKYGFKDAWIEVKNGGDYNKFSDWYKLYDKYWGNWDSVEKFLYRNGGGVEVTATDFEYICVKDEDGAELSDHSAAGSTFVFTKTADYTADTRTHTVATEKAVSRLINHLQWIFNDLVFVFNHFDEILELVSKL